MATTDSVNRVWTSQAKIQGYLSQPQQVMVDYLPHLRQIVASYQGHPHPPLHPDLMDGYEQADWDRLR